MNNLKSIIFWDFEGTLVNRPGLWRSALMEVLDENEPEHQVNMEQIRPYLRDGFPWHRPEESHTHLSTSKDWWSQMEQVFTRAYQGAGFDRNRAEELSTLVRKYFINPNRFILYEDTIPSLKRLIEGGWKHIILSNHIPELAEIVDATELSKYIDYCITSASTGYEKPSVKAFQNALSLVGNPQLVWMVGDNLEADVRGAESMSDLPP